MFRNQYDTDVTTWSPQGRLFQVEYAMEAVKQGSACVGATSSTHAVIAGIKRSPSELASYQQKVFRVDEHMGIVISGLTSDARSLCKYMRQEAMNHKFVFESPLQVERLVSDVADKHQKATQSYVRRPYGVGLLVAGYDRTGPHLFQTSPDGNYYAWHAMAIGARSQSAKTYLEKHFRDFKSLDRDGLIREALRALATSTESDKDLTPENTVVGIVGEGTRFHILENADIATYLASLGPVERPTGMVVDDEAPTASGAGEDAAVRPESGMNVDA